MPAAEVDITADLVRGLLTDQCPDLAGHDIVPLANGWDNVMFRLGREYVVRLPRRQLAAALIESEQRWLPELAPSLPLPIPAPVHAGRPGRGYPWCWSVVPWFDGEPALHVPPRDLDRAARALAGFLRALHGTAVPDDPPTNPFRGIPLADRDEITRNAINDRRVLARWEAALEVPPHSGPPVWLHGDLHPGNVLVHHGEVAAVIDFGDITAGDPAGDLFIAWALFPPAARAVFRDAIAVDDAAWARARGWAVAFGAVVLANSADNPAYHRLAQRMLDAVLAEPA
jgi:aminoglycoside phosphotransferase (APT) family kinase protein